jgi:NAD(P)-dependent dehydrogenase (short-subunit alcohol dehydrogenase family)
MVNGTGKKVLNTAQGVRRFEGKVAFVTGAGSGMGAAVAALLAEGGAAVALADRRAGPVEEVTARLVSKGGRALAIVADVAKAEDMRHAIERTVETFGALHLAVNAAGIASDPAPVGEVDPAAWAETIGINLSGVFYAMRYEIPAMLAAGGGSIVNISSVFADRGQDVRPAYAAAKHGIRGLTRSTAVDYGNRGIRVNELQPGVIRTPMIDVDRPRAEAFARHIPAQRLGTPEEIAAAVAFLLSEDASYINGAHLAVDGGFLA